MFSNHFTTNLSQNAAVKKIENRSLIGKDMDKTLWLTFLGPPCIIRQADQAGSAGHPAAR